MATHPTVQRRWPANAEASRQKAIELAEGVLELLDEALAKLDAQADKIQKRDHPMLTALDNAEAARDIARAARYAESIKTVLSEARKGVD